MPSGRPRSLRNWNLSTFFCLNTKESCKEKIKADEKLPECSFLRLKQTNSERFWRPSNSVCFLTPPSLPLRAAIFRMPNIHLTPSPSPQGEGRYHAKDLSAAGIINEVSSTVQQFHQVKLLSKPQAFHQPHSGSITVEDRIWPKAWDISRGEACPAP